MHTKKLTADIKQLGLQLGFSDVRITRPTDERSAMLFERWRRLNNHGDMHYMQRHGAKRAHPKQLFPKAASIITVSLNYLPESNATATEALENQASPYVSRYAMGRDYHKLMRKKLKKYAKAIEQITDKQLISRAFVDTAPILEKGFAAQSGLGWMGKHTNILNNRNGSFFFLGEIALNLPLTPDYPMRNRCGSCRRCIDVCPTQAITAPYQLDAEKCISYLTIEHQGDIPVALRPLIGNRIYGCDDCQLYCPWNKYAKITKEPDFYPRAGLDSASYQSLFSWDEDTFLKNTEGSPIRRIGHANWQRNLAVAIGNFLRENHDPALIRLLQRQRCDNEMVKRHIDWALLQIADSRK